MVTRGTPRRADDPYYGPVRPSPTSLGGLLARADARRAADAALADTVLDLRERPPAHHVTPPMIAALHDMVAEAAAETWWALGRGLVEDEWIG